MARGISPYPSHVELIEHAVVAHDRNVFELRLGDQHAIEGVAVLAGDASGTLRMENGDIQRDKTLRGHTADDVGSDV